MLDLTIFTQGLPNGAFRNRRYEFRFWGEYLYIPGDYAGKDQIDSPHHAEQERYLNSLQKNGVKPLWHGQWTFDKEAAAHHLLL
jgi:hypothetical protein